MNKLQVVFILILVTLIFIVYKGWILASLLLLSLILLLIIVLWVMKDPMSDTPSGFDYKDGDEVNGRRVTEVSPGIFNLNTKAGIGSHSNLAKSKEDKN